MSDKLFGLAGLGLDDLENMNIYGQDKKEEKAAAEAQKIEEKDLIFDKTFTCPVCGEDFPAKIMKTGKARLLSTDQDLRAKYEGIDAVKYDVILCPHCGYAALNRYFNSLNKVYIKLIKENISSKVQLHTYDDDIYSYEEAIERYKLCLANAVVKRAHASEKAYICLKSGWLMRGYQEHLEESGDTDMARLREVKTMEETYLKNAYTGFTEALQTEGFPMCGMDEITVEFLIAVLAARFQKYDVASRMVATILTSPSANARTKDKARELKDQILEELKNETRTIILYEAPHRLVRTLEELKETLGNRRMTLCRELTKRHETAFHTTIEELILYYQTEKPLGECVLVIEGRSRQEMEEEQKASWEKITIEEHMEIYENQGHSRKEAMKMVANDRGMTKRDVYQYLINKTEE